MSESINIIKLIEENPNTKLSKHYQGRLINKLKERFSTEEQQLFISSFYCYLNYKSDDYVIDLDDIWSWLGFARKTNAKTLLEKKFKLETDYKIVLPQLRENLQGGRPSEKIMLNINTFKKLCLMATTSKANEIHEYYIKLEETLHEIIDEESNELRLQLEQKENELLEKEALIDFKSNRIKLLEIKNSKKMERPEQGKNVVYVITNEYLEKDRTFIIGKAISLSNRLSQYNKNAEHKVVYQRECNNAKQMALIEEIILYKLDKYRERANRDRFILPEDREISLFTNVVDDACNWFNDVNEDVVIERLTDDKDKEYYEDNKEYIKEYKKQYYEENKEEVNKKNKSWYEENKEGVRLYNEKYREENEEKIKEQKKIYKEAHIEEYKERNARYYSENKDEIQVKQKLYQEENREKILKQRKEYYNENIEEIRAKDRARNPKVTCECGLLICKRSIPAHKKSKTHERFMKLLLDTKKDLVSDDIIIEHETEIKEAV
jgi:hypothetical protein